MIIDCHAHFDARILDLDRVVAKMDAAGVDKIAFVPSMLDPIEHTPRRLLDTVRVLMRHKAGRLVAERIHRATMTPEGDLRLGRRVHTIYARPDNDSVADAVKRHRGRFYGWIFLNPRNNPRVLDELEQWRAVPGMIGVKVHPHWHDYRTDLLDPILARAEALRLPLLVHLGFGKRGDYRAMAERFPKLLIIAAHAGIPFYDDLWVHARDLPNLVVDLSSPYLDEALARAAVKAMGAERCLYGTDAPYGFDEPDGSYDYGEIKGWIERMPVSTVAREKMLGGNFEEILDRARGL